MEIINYSEIYDESVKALLVELQQYIADADKEKFNILTDDFKEKYFEKTMCEVKQHDGKILLAKEKGKIIGLIVGIINNDAEETYCFRAPKRGRITELVVSEQCRRGGVGKALLERMEQYFEAVGCKGVLLDVFAYNTYAKNFYDGNGYFSRSIEMMKQI